MSANESEAKKAVTQLLVGLSVVFFLGGFYLAGSLFLAAKPWYIRALAPFLGVILAVVLLALSAHWEWLRELMRGARIEMYKVLWPGKDELVKMTLIVLAVVAIFSIFLTIVDGILTLLVRWVL